jgi:methionyl-tRNA formyltransferase
VTILARPLNIAFMGTPEFAVSALKKLIGCSDINVVCVYSQPPRPKGRGQQVQLSPVHQTAQSHGIPVRTPVNFKSPDDVRDFAALNLDLAVVAAYGLILPESILNAPKHGCLNIHASLLPRWRGAAPIQRAILAGDEETGITIMQMEKGLDTGPMILKKSVAIDKDTTAPALHDALSVLGGGMIVETLDQLMSQGTLPHTVQPEQGVTYAHMLKKDEGRIDWSHTAGTIARHIRALNPWPGTWCETAGGGRVKILSAVPVSSAAGGKVVGEILDADGHVACGENTVLRLMTVQPENKKPMDAPAAFNGGYLTPGNILN